MAVFIVLLPFSAVADGAGPPPEPVARFLQSAFGFCVDVTAHPSVPVARAAGRIPGAKLVGPAPLVTTQHPRADRIEKLLDVKAGDPVLVLTTPVPSDQRYHRTYARPDGKRCVVVPEQMPDAISAAIEYVQDPKNTFTLQYGGYWVRVYGRRSTAADGPVAIWVPRVASQGASSSAQFPLRPLPDVYFALPTLDPRVLPPRKGLFPEFPDQVVLLAAADRNFAEPVNPQISERWAEAVFDACFASALNDVAPDAMAFQGMLILDEPAKSGARSWSPPPPYPGAVTRTRKGRGGCRIELTAVLQDQELIANVWRRRALSLNPTKLRSIMGGYSRYTIRARRSDGRDSTVKVFLEPRYADSFYAITIGGR